jgi:hypothetical protein
MFMADRVNDAAGYTTDEVPMQKNTSQVHVAVCA